jgi:predicted alpha/beta hydrolase
MKKSDMKKYAYACGWTLARAHARSGDRIAIGHYLGKSENFDEAMAEFAVRYADQAESDYAKFMEAANGGRIELDTSVNK